MTPPSRASKSGVIVGVTTDNQIFIELHSAGHQLAWASMAYADAIELRDNLNEMLNHAATRLMQS